jgi:hypothetical protein
VFEGEASTNMSTGPGVGDDESEERDESTNMSTGPGVGDDEREERDESTNMSTGNGGIDDDEREENGKSTNMSTYVNLTFFLLELPNISGKKRRIIESSDEDIADSEESSEEEIADSEESSDDERVPITEEVESLFSQESMQKYNIFLFNAKN